MQPVWCRCPCHGMRQATAVQACRSSRLALLQVRAVANRWFFVVHQAPPKVQVQLPPTVAGLVPISLFPVTSFGYMQVPRATPSWMAGSQWRRPSVTANLVIVPGDLNSATQLSLPHSVCTTAWPPGKTWMALPATSWSSPLALAAWTTRVSPRKHWRVHRSGPELVVAGLWRAGRLRGYPSTSSRVESLPGVLGLTAPWLTSTERPGPRISPQRTL